MMRNTGVEMTIQFRDRPLKPGEKSHYYCDKCGEELHPDFAYNHVCDKWGLGKYEKKC